MTDRDNNNNHLNVVSFPVSEDVESIPRVVGLLEHWLSLAKEGKLRAVSVQGLCEEEIDGQRSRTVRYGMQGDSSALHMAGIIEQHVFSIRTEILSAEYSEEHVVEPEDTQDDE